MNHVQIHSSDILALGIVVCICALAWSGKVDGVVVSAVLGGIVGYLSKDREKEV